jgi:flagellar hook-associated protein 2
MPSISFGGLGNGIDFGQVVDQLVKASRLPVDRLTKKKTDLSNKLTDLTTLGGKLIALQSAADKLRLSTSFDRSTASVSDENALSVAASSTATAGSYSVNISQLAQSHQIANKAATAVAALTTSITTGPAAFRFKVGNGAVQAVSLAAGATIEDLRSSINDLGAGVVASAVNTGTEAAPAYRLVLTAAESGLAHQITVTEDGTSLGLAGGAGIDTLQAAQNAKISLGNPALNPVEIERSSNTISDAIDGVTLTLKKPTLVPAGPESGTPATVNAVQVNVARDPSAVKDNVKNFVKAYNDVVTFVNERTTYDPVTKQGGNLFNEPTARTVLSRIRGALSATVSGATAYTSVGQIGFKTERDGTITLDESQLTAALSTKYGSVKALLSNQGAQTGLAQSVVNAVDALDDVANGALSVRKNGLIGQITRVGQDISRQEDLLSKYEERLKSQFAALDGLLRQVQSQSGSLQRLTPSNQN